jgi:hypothetical protein
MRRSKVADADPDLIELDCSSRAGKATHRFGARCGGDQIRQRHTRPAALDQADRSILNSRPVFAGCAISGFIKQPISVPTETGGRLYAPVGKLAF